MFFIHDNSLFMEQRHQVAILVRYQHVQSDEASAKCLLDCFEEVIESPTLLCRNRNIARPEAKVRDDLGAYGIFGKLGFSRGGRLMSTIVHQAWEESIYLVEGHYARLRAHTKLFQ